MLFDTFSRFTISIESLLYKKKIIFQHFIYQFFNYKQSVLDFVIFDYLQCL